MAVQGGLLASSVSAQPLEERKRGVALFLLSKLIAYSVLGLLLGALGSFLALSTRMQAGLQLITGLFMLATAGRLLDVHPVFRYFVIQPPSWVYRLLRKKAKDASYLAPALLGAMTVFIPCGVTQAMMVIAMASGSPILGALIMATFTLGTSPVFAALGVSMASLVENKRFGVIAAVLVLIFAVLSLNGAVGLYGSPYTLQNFYKAATTTSFGSRRGIVAGVNNQGRQAAVVNVSSGGYLTDTATFRSGVPVELTLVSKNVNGCARAFTIPAMNISKILPVNGTEKIVFTPNRRGRLAFSCSMGMFTGSFEII